MGGGDSQTVTTQNPPWLDQSSQDILGTAHGLYDTSGGVPNANQQNAWDIASQWGQSAPAALGLGGSTLANLTGYQPDTSWLGPLYSLLGSNIGGGGGGGGFGAGAIPSFGGTGPHNYSPVNANLTSTDLSQIERVDPRSFTDYNMSDYLNPYTQNVIDAALGDNERSRELQGNADSAAGFGAGAYGGSRSGVLSALTNSEYDRNAGNLSAQMRDQAFNTASGLIENDITNDLAGQTTNAGTFNTGLFHNTDLANANSQFNAGQANQLTGARIGADASRDASRAAAGASMYGASLSAQNNRLSALINGALGLGQLGMNGDLNAGTLRLNAGNSLINNYGAPGLGALGGAGNAEHSLPFDDATWLSGINAATPHGSSTTQPLYHNRGAGAAGGAATGYEVSGGSPWGAVIGGLLGYVGS